MRVKLNMDENLESCQVCKVRERTGVSYTMASGKGMVLDGEMGGTTA